MCCSVARNMLPEHDQGLLFALCETLQASPWQAILALISPYVQSVYIRSMCASGDCQVHDTAMSIRAWLEKVCCIDVQRLGGVRLGSTTLVLR